MNVCIEDTHPVRPHIHNLELIAFRVSIDSTVGGWYLQYCQGMGGWLASQSVCLSRLIGCDTESRTFIIVILLRDDMKD